MDLQAIFFDARLAFTVVSFLTFVGIVVWAYSGRRVAAYAEAANLPFADDDSTGYLNSVEKQHG